jgi:Ion channel
MRSCDQCLEPHCDRLPHGSSDALEGRGLKTRPKGRADSPAGIDPLIPIEAEPSEKVARVRLGSYEFRKKGIARFDLRDPYHLAVALTWPQFLAALLGLYLSVNFVFTALYWAVPGSVANARPHSFADNLFFSIETLATIGYGEMYPATLYGRVVAATGIVCGFAFTAILTGVTFVRFSRPRAKLVFAPNPVVAMHNGKPTLMVRIGNGRPAILADAAAKLNVLLFRDDHGGQANPPRTGAAARAGAHSRFSVLLDAHACAG